MKKLLSLALSLLLLVTPVLSLADDQAVTIDVSGKLNAQQFLQFAQMFGITGEELAEMEATLPMIASVLDVMSLRFQTGDDCVKISLMAEDQEVLWFTAFEDEKDDLTKLLTKQDDCLALLSSLFPSYKVTIPLPDMDFLSDDMLEAFEDVDLEALGYAVMGELMAWASEVEFVEKTGSFAGPLFDNGTAQVVITVTDAQMCDLMATLLTVVENDAKLVKALENFLQQFGAYDVAGMLKGLKEELLSTTTDATYILEVTSDDVGELTVATLKVMSGETLAFSLSGRLNLTDAVAVMTVPLNGIETTLLATVDWSGEALVGKMSMWQTEPGMALEAIKKEQPLANYIVTAKVVEENGTNKMDVEVVVEMEGAQFFRETVNVEAVEGEKLDYKLKLYVFGEEEELFGLNISGAKSAPATYNDANCKAISAEAVENDGDFLAEVQANAISALSKALAVLPAEIATALIGE